jgi:outer membrane protein OmpA-like peptidoglycan-associated protein
MKNRMLIALLLAAVLIVPAVAQQSTSAQSSQPAASSDQAAPAAAQAQDMSSAQKSDNPDLASGKQPLTYESRQGFWGKINPFARKKYVQRQLSPIRDRVNELDELTASNSKMIKDVDSRAQEGIRLASAKATEADNHAVDAGNRAQQANQTATQATQRLTTVEQVVGNLDQYKAATQVELRFAPGQLALSKKAKSAIDDMATQLKDKKGYIVEVQGFSSGRGPEAVRNSQQMAESVVRYLVLNHEVPVWRIYTLGMGNAPMPASAESGKTRRTRGGRVEVSLMTNGVEQLGSQMASSEGAAPAAEAGATGGVSGSVSAPAAAQPATTEQPAQPASNMNAPAAPATSAPATQPPASPAPPAQPPQL